MSIVQVDREGNKFSKFCIYQLIVGSDDGDMGLVCGNIRNMDYGGQLEAKSISGHYFLYFTY